MAIISPLEYEDGDARDAGGSSSSAPASAAAPTPAPAPVPAPSASASSSTSTSASAGTRAPPPRAAQNHEELMSAFDSTPLFMRNLPEEEGNTAFEALQSLTHDGTPDEVAENFKKQGNEYFRGQRWREAAGFYTQGLDAYPTDQKLKETLHVNRAACNLELENYGQVLRDTSAALGLNPQSEKAFYRAARALHALDKNVEALDCCDHALLIDANNTAVKKLRERIVKRQVYLAKLEEERKERERRKNETERALKHAFLSRGLWLEVSSKPPTNPHPAHFDPDSLSPSSQPSIPLSGSSTRWTAPDPIRTPLILPVFFLYPQYQQSDLVSHFHEDTPVGAHLDAMFPPESRGQLPWDTAGEYVNSNLVVYASTHGKRLLKVGRKLTLRELMDQAAKDAEPGKGTERDGMEMKDGLLSIVVLPKGEAEKEWVERFKKEREASKKS